MASTKLRHPKLTAAERKALRIFYAKCKALHHHDLEPIEADGKPEFGIAVDLRCVNCGTVRRDIYGYNGDLVARWYDYPSGYRDVDRMTSGEWRLEWLKTLDGRLKRQGRTRSA